MAAPASDHTPELRAERFSLAPSSGKPVVTVCAPGAVRALIQTFLHGWELGPAQDGSAPAVACNATAQGFDLAAAVLPESRHRATSAWEAADVIASSAAALAFGGAGVILPHAAALLSPSGLVLLFADTTGGKSTLALTLATAGWRLFGDDRLAIRRAAGASVGAALGLAPKLRLPLPASAAELQAFVAPRLRRSGPSLAYLELRAREQAGPGMEAPVAACVLLDRSGGSPRLEPARPARLVRAPAESAAAPWLAPHEVLTAAAAHADLPVLRLRYGEAAEAALVLLRRFGGAG
jgi:hypothetical protein